MRGGNYYPHYETRFFTPLLFQSLATYLELKTLSVILLCHLCTVQACLHSPSTTIVAAEKCKTVCVPLPLWAGITGRKGVGGGGHKLKLGLILLSLELC